MKLHLQVGDLVLTVSDCDYTKREVRELLKSMSSIYLAIVEASAPAPEPEANPIGFSAHLERAPEMAGEDYYTDDDE
jgi:hypothetical protein